MNQSQLIEFLSPRMVGARFDEHAIPLEVLKDLAVLEETIIEIAKWCYLRDNPSRTRSPRGFTEGVALKLTGVGPGSAVPALNLYVESRDLFPMENQRYFELAKKCLTGAIDAAEHDEPITQHLPESLLSYFDRIGRSLRDGESIEFAPEERVRKARLTKATRRKLILASSQVQELTDEVTLRASIPEVDQEKKTFELQIINGPRVPAPLESQHLRTVMEAFNGYKLGARVLLHGVGRFNRFERLQKLESVEHLSLLDPNDIAARVEELKTLRNGWLDGKGFALEKEGLSWITRQFELAFDDGLPLPYIYPTAEGGVQAEWSIGSHEITLEIDIVHHKGEWSALNMCSDKENEKELDLDLESDWRFVSGEIEKIVATAS